MARVLFPDFLLTVTDGQREVEAFGETYRDLVAALEQRFPGVTEALEKTAVAIDGQIHQNAFLETLRPDSELVFMPKIEGG